MLGMAPGAFDAVDVVPGTPVHQRVGVPGRMMLAPTFERVVAPEGIGIEHIGLLFMVAGVAAAEAKEHWSAE